MEFEKFSKIARLSREVFVTEKIDGVNCQILITEDGKLYTGSRKRFLTLDDDYLGFAQWANEHKNELMQLGVGRHHGEWWGKGIQRTYGLDERRFSLFNTSLWTDSRPSCCGVVPILWRGNFDGLDVGKIMDDLKKHGSYACEGFMRPEGIVIYHTAGDVFFKKTFEHDGTGKRGME